MQDTVHDPAPNSPPRPAASVADWVRLALAPGVGGVSAHALLERFHTPAAIFAAGYEALCRVVSEGQALALCAPASDEVLREIDAIADWRALPGRAFITHDDPSYPRQLFDTPCAPLYLYTHGRRALLDGPAMAIVGSRGATRQGVANAEAFARALSEAGLTIVSGLALGIDAAAHRGGLAGAGATVAVVGTGADRIYPRANEALARQIAEDGCIVSEFSLGTPVMRGNFPRRNRIISGLAKGVLVVEAALKSGSLITARLAAAQGREVYAMPGSIHAPLARGCHALLREGACLVDTVADLLGGLASPAPIRLQVPLTPGQLALLDALGHAAIDVDTLAAQAGVAAGALAAQLLLLELAGRVERLPGGMFQRLHDSLPE